MAKKKAQEPNIVSRPPVVVVMGHIDHGKSKLLDHIRKANVVEGEVGGITQHLSAYVASHTTKEKETKRITFLDTPGHAAFQKMRFRGADVADIAILIVSAEDGVMPQTLEALECINKAGIPFIVAINKIDKPSADVEKTKASLVENEVYIEGMGGDIPWTSISAKEGTGIDELLDLLLLTAEFADLTGDTNAPAEGSVIEALVDEKRGNTGTLLIKNGTLRSGQFVVSGSAYAPTRIMEDWSGNSIKEASLSEPVGIVGFNEVPHVGEPFTAVDTKKEAEKRVEEAKTPTITPSEEETDLPLIPLLLKADTLGSIEAIEHEVEQFKSDRVAVRIIRSAVGDVTASDVQSISATQNAIIVGFNVGVQSGAHELAKRFGVEIDTFNIIYDLAEWLETALKNRTPKKEEAVTTGKGKILKHFSSKKNSHVVGGRVDEGSLSIGQRLHITRHDEELGTGTIKNIQQHKSDVKTVTEGEFGMEIDSKHEVNSGDRIEAYDIVVE